MDLLFKNITTVLFLIVLFRLILLTFKKLRLGYFSVAYTAVAGVFFFLGLPILLNIIFGIPDYSHYSGLALSQKFSNTHTYYNLYLIYICIIIYRYIKKNDNQKFRLDINQINRMFYKYRHIMWLSLLLPIILVFVTGMSKYYFEYKDVLKLTETNLVFNRALISRFTLLASICASFLFFVLLNNKKGIIFFKFICFTILLFTVFWIDAKRGIFFKFFFTFLAAGVLSGYIKPKKIFRYIIVGLSILTVVILSYGKDLSIGESNSYGTGVFYDNLRINIGRDHTVKYTLYKEFIDEDPILEYRGQSILFNVLFFVPRSMWPEKPYPYAVYYVTSVYNLPPEPMGWSLTTCVLEEIISNFGFFGLLIAPYFILWFCKVGDNSKNVYLKMLAIINIIFFLFTQLIAFMPLFLLFLLVLFLDKWKYSRMSLRNINRIQQLQEN